MRWSKNIKSQLALVKLTSSAFQTSIYIIQWKKELIQKPSRKFHQPTFYKFILKDILETSINHVNFSC
jgi:hypothetical protein